MKTVRSAPSTIVSFTPFSALGLWGRIESVSEDRKIFRSCRDSDQIETVRTVYGTDRLNIGVSFDKINVGSYGPGCQGAMDRAGHVATGLDTCIRQVETAIGIAFLVHRTCRFADRAGSKEEGRATPVHASIVSSANWILNRRMLEKSMGLKDNLWFDGRRAGKHATRR